MALFLNPVVYKLLSTEPTVTETTNNRQPMEKWTRNSQSRFLSMHNLAFVSQLTRINKLTYEFHDLCSETSNEKGLFNRQSACF